MTKMSIKSQQQGETGFDCTESFEDKQINHCMIRLQKVLSCGEVDTMEWRNFGLPRTRGIARKWASQNINIREKPYLWPFYI